MPPKTITCSVCKQEVTKASTLEIAPGVRACRVHDGVTDRADAKQIAAKEAEKKRQEAAKESRTVAGIRTLAPLLTPQEDGMVWFKIFEHTLSEGGCYYLNVHPETWQATLSKSTYGMYRMLEKFPTVEDAVHFISENHWYENPDQDED